MFLYVVKFYPGILVLYNRSEARDEGDVRGCHACTSQTRVGFLSCWGWQGGSLFGVECTARTRQTRVVMLCRLLLYVTFSNVGHGEDEH